MPTRVPRRSLALVSALMLVVVAACGTVSTAVCTLASFATDMQQDLDELLALDPALVAQAGTPEQAAALDAVDSLEATRSSAQEALDAASEDEVGPIIRSAFETVLDATGVAVSELRSAIESGDPALVTEAMGYVQIASDAIDAFNEAIAGRDDACPSASASAQASEEASEAASVAPSATAEPTPVPTEEPTPTPTPTPTPSPTPTPTPSPTPTPTPTPSPTPSPSPSPSPSPTASPSSSPSPTESAVESASVEVSPSPSGEPSDGEDGGIGWLIPLGLAAIGGAVAFVWWQSRREPPDDLQGPDGAGPPPPPVAPDDIREVGPDADTVAATEPPPPPPVSTEPGVAPAAAAAPEAAESIADETEPIHQPGPDPVASGHPSDAVPPREDGAPGDRPESPIR